MTLEKECHTPGYNGAVVVRQKITFRETKRKMILFF